MLDIRLLGQFAVARDGRPLTIPSRPAQLLLAWLALNAGRPQPREELADRLWPDSSAANARANLRHALWQLRAALDDDPRRAPCLHHDTHTITLDAGCAIDAAALARERPSWSTADLLAAVSCGGELLPGFYEPWVVLERERLAAVYDRRMATLLDRLAEDGRWDEVVEWAERWIAMGSAPESGYRAIMRACAARGDAGGVAAAYRRCRAALREALDVEPSAETQRLVELATHMGVPPTADAGREEPPAAADPAAFERGRAEFYRRAARRSNRLALAALLGLAAAVGVAVAGRLRGAVISPRSLSRPRR